MLPPDSTCPFLDLPLELRDRIYSEALSDTTITFPTVEDHLYSKVPSDTTQITLPTVKKSRPSFLPLLYTCPQINADIGLRWLGWVRFDFHSVVSLLDVLTARPDTEVSAIRHIQVSGRPLLLSFKHYDSYYGLVWVLKMLPQLKLHTLTVLGGYTIGISGGPAQADHITITNFVEYGTGWKELRYISPDSSLLSPPKYKKFGATCIREPQPRTWRAQLTYRDGRGPNPNLGASVTIWRSKTNTAGAVLNGHELELFEPRFAPEDLEKYTQEPGPDLTKPGENDKEVLIVIKRAKKADIMEHIDHGQQFEGCDLRALGMKWPQIRKRFIGRRDGDTTENNGPIEIPDDGYNLGAMDGRWLKVRQELNESRD